MYNDVLEDVIFSDFLVSAKLAVDPAEVLEACKDLMKSDPGVVRSNGPETWHSSLGDGMPPNALGDAIREGLTFADDYLRDRYNLGLSDGYEWWVNSTKFGGYNSPHIHGSAELIGIYYPKVPDNSSKLVLLRNDGSTYTKLFIERPYGQRMEVTPEEGRFYLFPGHIWHYVDAHVIEEERVSVSFNLNLIQIQD